MALTLLSFGQAAKLALTDCDAPLMVSVALQTWGPVPIGSGDPISLMLNCHCVPAGESTAFDARFMLKLPAASVLPLVKMLTLQGVLLWPLQGGGIVGVMPEGMSCAWTVAKEYGVPLESCTVPLTTVVFWALIESAHRKKTAAAVRTFENLRTIFPPLLLHVTDMPLNIQV